MNNTNIPSLLLYHLIDPKFYWGITRVPPAQFQRQMDFLAEGGYRVVTLTQALDSERERSNREVCITFDDAYETVFEYAYPVLEKYDFPAVVFVISGYVAKINAWDVIIGHNHRRHMNWQQLRTLLSSGWEIGSHGHTHKDLTSLPTDELRDELHLSKMVLEDNLGEKVELLSYPFGRFNRRVMETARSVGYRAASTTTLPSNLKKDAYWPFNLSRRPVYLVDRMKDFKSKLQSDRNNWYQPLKEKLLSFGCKGTILVSHTAKKT